MTVAMDIHRAVRINNNAPRIEQAIIRIPKGKHRIHDTNN
jgi:hypothetical protein